MESWLVTAEPWYARYDYAWNTPAWTAQNPVISGIPGDGAVGYAWPEDVSKVTVALKRLDGQTSRGLEGVLRIRVEDQLVYATTGERVQPWVRTIRFKPNGVLLTLPATDDPTLAKPGGGSWTYHARVTAGGYTDEFEFSLPYTASVVNLDTLVP
jgi:hypothetical protein